MIRAFLEIEVKLEVCGYLFFYSAFPTFTSTQTHSNQI